MCACNDHVFPRLHYWPATGNTNSYFRQAKRFQQMSSLNINIPISSHAVGLKEANSRLKHDRWRRSGAEQIKNEDKRKGKSPNYIALYCCGSRRNRCTKHIKWLTHRSDLTTTPTMM